MKQQLEFSVRTTILSFQFKIFPNQQINSEIRLTRLGCITKENIYSHFECIFTYLLCQTLQKVCQHKLSGTFSRRTTQLFQISNQQIILIHLFKCIRPLLANNQLISCQMNSEEQSAAPSAAPGSPVSLLSDFIKKNQHFLEQGMKNLKPHNFIKDLYPIPTKVPAQLEQLLKVKKNIQKMKIGLQQLKNNLPSEYAIVINWAHLRVKMWVFENTLLTKYNFKPTNSYGKLIQSWEELSYLSWKLVQQMEMEVYGDGEPYYKMLLRDHFPSYSPEQSQDLSNFLQFAGSLNGAFYKSNYKRSLIFNCFSRNEVDFEEIRDECQQLVRKYFDDEKIVEAFTNRVIKELRIFTYEEESQREKLGMVSWGWVNEHSNEVEEEGDHQTK